MGRSTRGALTTWAVERCGIAVRRLAIFAISAIALVAVPAASGTTEVAVASSPGTTEGGGDEPRAALKVSARVASPNGH